VMMKAKKQIAGFIIERKEIKNNVHSVVIINNAIKLYLLSSIYEV